MGEVRRGKEGVVEGSREKGNVRERLWGNMGGKRTSAHGFLELVILGLDVV